MRFDFVIGNPPYQEETKNKSETNGQAPRKNIFHHFQIQADEVSKGCSVLIYPGIRWMHQSGKGLKQFGKNLINDTRLSTIEFFPDAKDVFGNAADVADGITIVVKKSEKHTEGFEYIYSRNGNEQKVFCKNPGNDLIPLNPNDLLITNKIKEFVNNYHINFLHEAILPRSLFGIESDFVEKNPKKVRVYNEGGEFDTKREIKIFTNDKSGPAGRTCWFITDREVIASDKQEYISQWQVVVSSAHAGGQYGRDNQIAIMDNYSAFGRARVALRSFKTQEEAQNFYDFARTYVIKYAFLMTAEALSTLGLLVPDIMNYKNDNGIIDFSKDIDEQLFNMLRLTESEITYIKDTIDNLRKKGDGVR